VSLNLDKSTWKRVSFGDVVNNVNQTVRDADSAGIDRIIAMEHMDPGELKVKRWGATKEGTTFTRRVKPGQTLFGKRRAYQRKVAYAEFDAVCSSDIYTFEADESQLLGELLPFLVQSNEFFDHALDTSAGSLSPRTNWRDLANFEFDLPPLDEQKRLADLLWAVERHRLALRVEVETAASALRLWRAKLVNDPDARVVRASEAFEFSTGVRRTPERAIGPYMTPYLRSANVGYGVLDLSDVLEMNYEPAERDRFALRRGDVLVSEGSASAAAVGMPARWSDEIPGPVCFQMTLLRLRAVPELCLPEFVFHWSMWAYESGRFLEVAGGTNIKHISALRSSQMPVRLPALDQQRKLVAQLESMGDSIALLQGQADRLDRVLDAALADIFGGS
jgi:type I restriction enzyme S subunit